MANVLILDGASAPFLIRTSPTRKTLSVLIIQSASGMLKEVTQSVTLHKPTRCEEGAHDCASSGSRRTNVQAEIEGSTPSAKYEHEIRSVIDEGGGDSIYLHKKLWRG